MKKIRVIYRDCGGEVTAFFPDFPTNFGMIACYSHIGQHGEADASYYRNSKPASENAYKPLHDELSRVYSDFLLVVKKRFPRR